MDFQDLIVGSGLSALGVALGLEGGGSVGVICGSGSAGFRYYDHPSRTPCSFAGDGGLGNHWHGVIPLGLRGQTPPVDSGAIAKLLEYFYPRLPIDRLLGTPSLFVPWRPIRPRLEFARLIRSGANITLVQGVDALSFDVSSGIVSVRTTGGALRARRLWLAAGVLGTPRLIAGFLGHDLSRETISDHVFCYVGQTVGLEPPKVSRMREGVVFPARYSDDGSILYTVRPAFFDFRRVDAGLEKRAVFGLATEAAVSRMFRIRSPGLVMEAIYNRFGGFSRSSTYNIYAQVEAPDAYNNPVAGSAGPSPRMDEIAPRMRRAREQQPFDGVVMSTQEESFLPGIHLHHSLDSSAVRRSGLDSPTSPVRIVDASTVQGIGAEHHSFKIMAAAFSNARDCLEQDLSQ